MTFYKQIASHVSIVYSINQITLLAAVLYIVALQFCSGTMIVFRHAYKLQLLFAAQDTNAAPLPELLTLGPARSSEMATTRQRRRAD